MRVRRGQRAAVAESFIVVDVSGIVECGMDCDDGRDVEYGRLGRGGIFECDMDEDDGDE